MYSRVPQQQRAIPQPQQQRPNSQQPQQQRPNSQYNKPALGVPRPAVSAPVPAAAYRPSTSSRPLATGHHVSQNYDAQARTSNYTNYPATSSTTNYPVASVNYPATSATYPAASDYYNDEAAGPLGNVVSRGGQGKTMFEDDEDDYYPRTTTTSQQYGSSSRKSKEYDRSRDSPRRGSPRRGSPKRVSETKTIKLTPPRASTSNAGKKPKADYPNHTKDAKDEQRKKNWQPADGWVKQGKSRQDQISQDEHEFTKRFEGYVEIKPQEYSDIQPGTAIRYMKHNPSAPFQFDYRAGGLLVRNGYPDYWVLKPYDGRGKNWSVPLKGQSRYFRKDSGRKDSGRKDSALKDSDDGEQQRVKARNAKLYEKVEAGELLIIDKDAFANMKEENEELQELKKRLKELERTVKAPGRK